MKLKTSFFSRTIFLNQLKRFWPLYALYFAVLLIMIPVALGTMLGGQARYGAVDARDAANGLLQIGYVGGAFVSFFFGIAFSMAAFHYLYSSRSVSQMCALPVRRGGVFLSNFAPGLAVMLASNAVCCLLAVIVASGYGIDMAGYAAQTFAMLCLTNLFFYGFAALCAALTGNIITLPIVYTVLNFTVYVVISLTQTVLSRFVFGFDSIGETAGKIAMYLSPLVYILADTNVDMVSSTQPAPIMSGSEAYSTEVVVSKTGHFYSGWLYLIIIAAVGALMVLGAMALVKRRRMETAGDVVAARPLKPAFKYCLSLGCALVAGIGLYYIIFGGGYSALTKAGNVVYITAFMLTGAFIGYFAAEMLMQKSLRVFSGRVWRGFAAVAAVVLIFTFSCKLDLFGFERRVPEVSEVESVLVSDSVYVKLQDPADISVITDIHRSVVSNKKLYESAADGSYGSVPLRFIYTLKDGSTFSRAYNLPLNAEAPDLQKLQDFLNTPEMILRRNDPGMAVTPDSIIGMNVDYYDEERGEYAQAEFTAAQAYELYTECMLPDMRDGKLGLVDITGYGYPYNTTGINIYLAEHKYIAVYGDDNRNAEVTISEMTINESINITVTKEAARTIAWLEARGIRLTMNN